MNYDPTIAPDPDQWLDAHESDRFDAVYNWFTESGFPDEDEAHGRAAVLATLETQVASRDPSVVAETLEQLESEGLERLLAVFAMASILDEMLREVTSQKTEFDLYEYKTRIRALNLDLIQATAAENQSLGGELPPFDSSQQRLLEAFTERHADDEVLSFPAMAGFLLAVTCAPRLALPAEWLPCLIGDIEFDTQQESEAVVGAIMSLLNWILDEAQSTPSQPLPADCRPDRDPMANLEEGSRFGQWCDGLAMGQTLFEQDWEEALLDDHQRMRLSGSFTTLSFFSSPEVASEVRTELARMGERMPLKKLASLMHRSIPDAIADYVDLGYQLRNGPSRSSAPKQPARSQKIGRNEPCPCGSGKKYKKCCGRPGA